MSDFVIDTDLIDELHNAEREISAQEDTDAVFRLRKAARDVVEAAAGPQVFLMRRRCEEGSENE